MLRWSLLAASIAFAGVAHAQSTRYVTDSLRLEARSGPGTENRILRMLESGTRLEVLEDTDGWSRVSLPGGEEGWILTRFLMDEPSARNRLATVTGELDASRARVAKLQEEMAQLRSDNEALRTSMDELETDAGAIARELAELKRTAASAVELRDENGKLKLRSGELEQRLTLLQQDFALLRDARNRDWFIAGAGVLLGGMLLGLIIPKIRWRRRRGWGEL